jgi:hypothetical protein
MVDEGGELLTVHVWVAIHGFHLDNFLSGKCLIRPNPAQTLSWLEVEVFTAWPC